MHKYDTRDAAEHEAVRSVLAALPPDHEARRAYDEDGATTIALSHLVGDDELIERLKTAYLDGWGRIMDRSRGFRPS